MIWDILGSKTNRFDSIYYKGVKGALLVSDITRENTLDSLSEWISGLFEVTGEIPIVLLANKIDLENKKEEMEEKISEYGNDYHSDYMLTSAKTGENVESAFLALAMRLIEDMVSDKLVAEVE
jgi:GTPase SAR1 family protein